MEENIVNRICSKCGTEKPFTLEHFMKDGKILPDMIKRHADRVDEYLQVFGEEFEGQYNLLQK